MKNLILLVFYLITISCSQELKEITGPFIIKEGVKYQQEKPFQPINGFIKTFYENESLKTLENYEDGKLNGMFEGYHYNGQLKEKSIHDLFVTYKIIRPSLIRFEQ